MRLISFFALIAIISLSGNAFAQQGASIGCIDKAIRTQAEDLKLGFTKHGMEVYKDANVTMQSETPYPVAVQLTKGIMYQMIFVGDQLASNIRFELFNGDDKKLGEKLMKKNDPNYIIYSFIPEKTDIYLVVLSQRRKNESLCSSFTILQPPAINKPQQTGIVPSENVNANPRYKSNSSDPQNTNPRYVPSNTTQQSTTPRYVSPGNTQQKTNNSPQNTNPRYKPQAK